MTAWMFSYCSDGEFLEQVCAKHREAHGRASPPVTLMLRWARQTMQQLILNAESDPRT